MRTRTEKGEIIGPARMLELLEQRFGAFQAIAYAALTLAERDDLEMCPPMDKATAWAILEFGSDLSQAFDETEKWADAHFGRAAPRPAAEQ